MATDVRLKEPLVVILTETIGIGASAVTRKVELRGDEAVKAAAQIRANLLSPPVAEPVEEPQPPVPVGQDYFNPMIGGTVREARAAEREQRLWNEAHPVMPSYLCHQQQRQWCEERGVDPPCGPSRKGIVSQFLDIFGS